MDIALKDLAELGLSGVALLGVILLYKALMRHEDGCGKKWERTFNKLESNAQAIAHMQGKVDILLSHDDQQSAANIMRKANAAE